MVYVLKLIASSILLMSVHGLEDVITGAGEGKQFKQSIMRKDGFGWNLENGRACRRSPQCKSGQCKDKKCSGHKGMNHLSRYDYVATRFVGLNPKDGEGSGFLGNDITATPFPQDGKLTSNTGRNDLCTCDCTASPDGVGCAGWGGIRFRYTSLLWVDPFNKSAWTGRMQAYQVISGGSLNFIGSDVRLSPGGPAVYDVACTSQMCADAGISGVFRQSNTAVSCVAALAEDSSLDTSCAKRCEDSAVYAEWLAYCAAEKEDKSLGFSGWGV